MNTLQALATALALLATLGLLRLWWTRPERGEGQPTLSPDLLPRPSLRHWLTARGSSVAAWGLAEAEARARRRNSLRLSGHGTISVDSGEDRDGRLGPAEGREPKIRLVKGRRTA